ncbi:membrane protein YczE [Plantactinospora sonchi]|uniref:Membrane protein YczE n=1 Tax=Plantactinospora sonchi TaxID=1544735 RepID=A0ABU7RW12_9ACTN
MTTIGNRPDRLARRLLQLYAGLALYGLSIGLMIESTLGLDPWDVFHQGLSRLTGASIGTVTIVVGALVLLLWIPLRQRPGFGTVSNVVVVGVAADLALAVLPTVTPFPTRIGFLVAGVVLNGVATGLYIGARFGPGPRDGLMTGFVARHPRHSIRMVRTVIEVTVLAVGWLLDGTVGIGTVVYALSIGPLVHLFIPMFTVPPTEPGRHGPITGTARQAATTRIARDVPTTDVSREAAT